MRRIQKILCHCINCELRLSQSNLTPLACTASQTDAQDRVDDLEGPSPKVVEDAILTYSCSMRDKVHALDDPSQFD